MKNLTGEQIRRMWIEFFESKGHKYIKGVSLIPQGDKSLLWVNAGVTGLKKYFDGTEIPPCRRIVNVQKSIRTNDIENVGHTARHHTFFEMLGNFSIGDYFRKEVIAFAIEILTSPKWFDMDIDRLYVTYNPSDLDAFECWKSHGVKEDHLVPLESNYWQIGEGPCGPNTEVFYDRGEKYDPQHLGRKLLEDDIENDRYIEIWGIVFSQYNAVNGVDRKDYKELPSKNIDTGSGLERLACIMQGTETNFETDLFTPIMKAAEDICHKPYEGENLLPYRVIADHARCLTFALSDGASFSNEGRGYVLRRIIRRAMRYGQKLGIDKPFMHSLVDVVVDNYSSFYPELRESRDRVKKQILDEENRFIKTLTEGEALLRDFLSRGYLSGEEAFRLYDTYGFPLDLTQEIAAESGVSVDVDRFNELMEQQKERARSARGEIESFHKQSKDLLEFKESSDFTYDSDSVKAKVTGLFKDGVKVESIDDEGDIATDVTPFYAEAGGQVSDTGSLLDGSVKAEVTGVFKAPAGQHLCHVKVNGGSIKLGDEVTLSVDEGKRRLIERNHSATHLLHAAIGEVLGAHVDQKGSYVDEDYLRFDFSFDRKLTEEELDKIAEKVNEMIASSIEEKTLVLPIEEAKKLGAEMEFSEKYGDTVRVVTFGDVSKEFCGGTHVKNSADIGLFAIVSESSTGSGVRRIEAKTSLGALNFLLSSDKQLSLASSKLGCKKEEVVAKVGSLQDDLSKANKEIEHLKQKISAASAKGSEGEFEDVSGVKFLLKSVELGREDMLKLGDSLKSNKQDYLIVLLSTLGQKKPMVVFASGLGEGKLGAGAAMKLIAPLLSGNGGGSPKMASGAYSDASKSEQAKQAIKEKLA